MSKIYDCFCFFNEFDILDLRLNILDPYVDYFVLCESSVTHVGTKKPFFFDENKERYKQFLGKIIHLKIEDSPDRFTHLPVIKHPQNYDDVELNKIYDFIATQTERFNVYSQPNYGRDFFQKECVRRGLEGCSDDDVIISSDVDEIPDPEILKNIAKLDRDKYYTFNQNFYCYYLNVLKERNWGGSRMGSYGKLKNYSYNELRAQQNIILEEGGWHFSFMGGPEQVRKKLTSYSAADLANSTVIGAISNNMNNSIDPFFRGRMQVVAIDDSYPKYLIDNIEKYKHMLRTP